MQTGFVHKQTKTQIRVNNPVWGHSEVSVKKGSVALQDCSWQNKCHGAFLVHLRGMWWGLKGLRRKKKSSAVYLWSQNRQPQLTYLVYLTNCSMWEWLLPDRRYYRRKPSYLHCFQAKMYTDTTSRISSSWINQHSFIFCVQSGNWAQWYKCVHDFKIIWKAKTNLIQS